MSFSITGIAFTAMSSNTIDRTKDELRNEQIITKETQEIASNVSYMTKEKSNLVAFNDPLSGDIAIVSLSSATMDKLKAHFGENDFYKREDGITRLNNKAEAFVGGWFGDIAYKREFLSADKNNDGKLDSNEYLDTRNEFNGHAEEIFSNGEVISSHEQIDEIYQKVSSSKVKGSVSYSANKNQKTNSIDEELNDTLDNDGNFDSKISLKESYAQPFMSDEKMIKTHIEEYRKTNPNYGHEGSGNIIMDELLKKQQALAKLMASGGDISKLSAEERSLLAGELSQYKKEENDFNIKLDKALNKSLDEEISMSAEEKVNMREEQIKKISVIGKVIENNGDVNKLTQEEQTLIKDEIEHSKSNDGNIDIDKLKQIQEYQKAKISYTEIDIQPSKLYVQKG